MQAMKKLRATCSWVRIVHRERLDTCFYDNRWWSATAILRNGMSTRALLYTFLSGTQDSGRYAGKATNRDQNTFLHYPTRLGTRARCLYAYSVEAIPSCVFDKQTKLGATSPAMMEEESPRPSLHFTYSQLIYYASNVKSFLGME